MKKIGQIPGVLGRLVRSYRFPLAAFLLPLFIRTIPETLVGPYPKGWDTIAFYVPNTLGWARENRVSVCAESFRGAVWETLPES